MGKVFSALTRALIFATTLAAWSLYFVNEAGAPPPEPPPPGPASGTIAQIAAITVVGAYGAFKVLRKK